MMKTITGLIAALIFSASGAISEEAGGGDLRSAVQNPINSLISVPLKFQFDNGAPNGKSNSLTIQPVIRVTVGDLNLISRFIIPLYDAPGGVTGIPSIPGGGSPTPAGRTTSLGDINYTLFVSPAAATNGIAWGVGPSLTAPTATDDRLGAGKWTGGLSGIALVQPGCGTYGVLCDNCGPLPVTTLAMTLVSSSLNLS